MNTRAILRKTVRSRRQQLTLSQQKKASNLLLANLINHKEVISAKRIALYLANDSELDAISFIHWCWNQNKEIYLPVLHPFCTGHLLFLRYKKNTIMVTNKYGILEPTLNVTQVCPINKLDVLFTPLVAFDEEGARLGMGGGFYDRSLANWHNTDQPISTAQETRHFHPIGLAHDCQLVTSIPVESWDVPLPEIITPSKIYHF